jgi:hypothetical protein
MSTCGDNIFPLASIASCPAKVVKELGIVGAVGRADLKWTKRRPVLLTTHVYLCGSGYIGRHFHSWASGSVKTF